MEWVRSYVMTVTAAGILCAIVKNLSSGKAGSRMLGLTCGVFLMLAAISPIYSVDVTGWEGNLEDFRAQAQGAQEETTEKIQAQLDTDIESQVAAYIVDKGAALGAALEVEVSLESRDGYSLPESARISGSYSPYIKAQMESILEQDLGIPRQRQEWN